MLQFYMLHHSPPVHKPFIANRTCEQPFYFMRVFQMRPQRRSVIETPFTQMTTVFSLHDFLRYDLDNHFAFLNLYLDLLDLYINLFRRLDHLRQSLPTFHRRRVKLIKIIESLTAIIAYETFPQFETVRNL